LRWLSEPAEDDDALEEGVNIKMNQKITG